MWFRTVEWGGKPKVVILNNDYWEEMLENVKKKTLKNQQPPTPTNKKTPTQTNQPNSPKPNKNLSLLEVDFE